MGNGDPTRVLCSPVVELRQYTLHPGQRDTLIDLFDREFVESQEALGARIIGQFRDLDHPNRFVWLRGFQDMPTRREALQAFYSGPVWKAHSAAANATMLDKLPPGVTSPPRSAMDSCCKSSTVGNPISDLNHRITCRSTNVATGAPLATVIRF